MQGRGKRHHPRPQRPPDHLWEGCQRRGAPRPADGHQAQGPQGWKIIGKPLLRLDTADKITGKQVYAIDVKLPGMLNASIMDAPVFDAKVKSYDEAKAKAMPGVRHVVKVGDTAVAVVADGWWQANQVLKALNIAWEEGPNDKVSSEFIQAHLQDGLDAKDGAFIGNRMGEPTQAIAGAAKKLEAVYFAPFENHFTMEPMNCTALVTAIGARYGEQRKTPKAAWRPPPKQPGFRPPNASFTSCIWVAASGDGVDRTTQPRLYSSPSRSPASRSS